MVGVTNTFQILFLWNGKGESFDTQKVVTNTSPSDDGPRPPFLFLSCTWRKSLSPIRTKTCVVSGFWIAMTILQITSQFSSWYSFLVIKAVPSSMIHTRSTEWNFSITQILREINVGESRRLKSAIFNTFRGSDFFFFFAFFLSLEFSN